MSSVEVPTNQPSAQQVGINAGNRFFEMTRRRLASGAAGNRRDLSRFFAGRGGGGGSSAAFATRKAQEGERSALSDASLQAQLQGERVGREEGQFREGIRRFNQELTQRNELANLDAETRLKLQQNSFQNQLKMFRLNNRLQSQNRRSGLFGSVLRGLGAGAIGLMSGGTALPLLAGGVSGLSGAGEGGGLQGDPLAGQGGTFA